ncbi:MAG TPA: YciI family protein [Pseudonocardia sp.]|nr:YciI family protein [Pseudonocardia sp.]
MEYIVLAFEDEDGFAARDDQARAAEYWSSWNGYIEALTSSGVLSSAGGLDGPVTSTTVRVRDGQRLVQDGPFADTKEQLGGYFVIDVPDLTAALDWAERCPAARYGSVEVRPLLRPMR